MSPILSARGGMSARAYGWGAAVAGAKTFFANVFSTRIYIPFFNQTKLIEI